MMCHIPCFGGVARQALRLGFIGGRPQYVYAKVGVLVNKIAEWALIGGQSLGKSVRQAWKVEPPQKQKSDSDAVDLWQRQL